MNLGNSNYGYQLRFQVWLEQTLLCIFNGWLYFSQVCHHFICLLCDGNLLFLVLRKLN